MSMVFSILDSCRKAGNTQGNNTYENTYIHAPHLLYKRIGLTATV